VSAEVFARGIHFVKCADDAVIRQRERQCNDIDIVSMHGMLKPKRGLLGVALIRIVIEQGRVIHPLTIVALASDQEM